MVVITFLAQTFPEVLLAFDDLHRWILTGLHYVFHSLLREKVLLNGAEAFFDIYRVHVLPVLNLYVLPPAAIAWAHGKAFVCDTLVDTLGTGPLVQSLCLCSASATTPSGSTPASRSPVTIWQLRFTESDMELALARVAASADWGDVGALFLGYLSCYIITAIAFAPFIVISLYAVRLVRLRRRARTLARTWNAARAALDEELAKIDSLNLPKGDEAKIRAYEKSGDRVAVVIAQASAERNCIGENYTGGDRDESSSTRDRRCSSRCTMRRPAREQVDKEEGQQRPKRCDAVGHTSSSTTTTKKGCCSPPAQVLNQEEISHDPPIVSSKDKNAMASKKTKVHRCVLLEDSEDEGACRTSKVVEQEKGGEQGLGEAPRTSEHQEETSKKKMKITAEHTSRLLAVASSESTRLLEDAEHGASRSGGGGAGKTDTTSRRGQESTLTTFLHKVVGSCPKIRRFPGGTTTTVVHIRDYSSAVGEVYRLIGIDTLEMDRIREKAREKGIRGSNGGTLMWLREGEDDIPVAILSDAELEMALASCAKAKETPRFWFQRKKNE
ncbi:unnamed protein product [Amoebophrya sp. A25]|nr:unnamed protein product [Amoebophrya sp. A25]|eukprot:GSA25T00024000001.1